MNPRVMYIFPLTFISALSTELTQYLPHAYQSLSAYMISTFQQEQREKYLHLLHIFAHGHIFHCLLSFMCNIKMYIDLFSLHIQKNNLVLLLQFLKNDKGVIIKKYISLKVDLVSMIRPTVVPENLYIIKYLVPKDI